MNIGFDARLWGLEHTGIGRYIMELLPWILKLDTKNNYTIFASSQHIKDIPKNIRVKIIPTDIRHYSLKEQLILPKIIKSHNLDFIHFPHFNVPLFLTTPTLVTIHDLLWHEIMGIKVTTLKPIKYLIKYLGYRAVVRKAIFSSLKIFTPSHWIKSNIISRFAVNPAKIIVTHEGIGQTFSKTIPHEKGLPATRSLSIEKPFIVYTGSLYPHKNVKTIIKALKKINTNSGKPLTLVIVGSRSNFYYQTRQFAYKLDQQRYVKLIGFLSDQQLTALYQHALALVHPSTSEGFGLTGLEAMAAGLPVISSKAASLPEVYGDAALYFDPKNTDQLVAKIKLLSNNLKLRTKLIKAGKLQTQKYSWETTAKITLAAYESSSGL